jgi:hypothetical protein
MRRLRRRILAAMRVPLAHGMWRTHFTLLAAIDSRPSLAIRPREASSNRKILLPARVLLNAGSHESSVARYCCIGLATVEASTSHAVVCKWNEFVGVAPVRTGGRDDIGASHVGSSSQGAKRSSVAAHRDQSCSSSHFGLIERGEIANRTCSEQVVVRASVGRSR